MRNTLVAAVAALCFVTAAEAQRKEQPAGGNAAPPATVTSIPEQPSLESAKRITRDEAMKLVKENRAVFVDVRARDQYDAGHIKGALGIPEAEMIIRLKEVPKGKMIITYCA